MLFNSLLFFRRFGRSNALFRTQRDAEVCISYIVRHLIPLQSISLNSTPYSDEDNPNNKDSSNAVYTTEGHILPLHRNKLEFKPSISKYTQVSAPTCTPYTPANDTLHHWSPLALGIDKRNDAEYARRITGLELDPVLALKSGLWDPNGFCKLPVLPKVRQFAYCTLGTKFVYLTDRSSSYSLQAQTI